MSIQRIKYDGLDNFIISILKITPLEKRHLNCLVKNDLITFLHANNITNINHLRKGEIVNLCYNFIQSHNPIEENTAVTSNNVTTTATTATTAATTAVTTSNTTTTTNAAPKEEIILCNICIESKNTELMVNIPCGHVCCKACITKIKTRAKTNGNALLCPYCRRFVVDSYPVYFS